MNKWYQSRTCKGILIGLAHVAAVIALVSFAQLLQYSNVSFDVLLGTSTTKEYEDTENFAQEVRSMSMDAVNAVVEKQRLETDGKYDPDKMVNIMTGEILAEVPEGDNGLWYRMGDLIEWGEADIYYDASNYVVCEKKDETYQYYKQNEFEKLLNSGELRLELAEEEAAAEQDTLAETGDIDYHSYIYYGGNILNKNGDIVYVDFWEFYCELNEKYMTIGDKDLISVTNTDPEWNGKLQEIIDALVNSIYEYYEYYVSYTNGYDYLKEGNSNFSFLLVDIEAKRVYTNREEYADYTAYEQNVDKLKDAGKYLMVTPKLADFSSNILTANANDWQQYMHDLNMDNYVFAVAVDTAYPIQDVYYSSHNAFQKYNSFVAIGSLLVFIIAVIWLTAVAGRSRAGDDLVLNRFDRWKTEMACAVIAGVWIFMMLFLVETGVFEGVTSSTPAIVGIAGFVTCSIFLTGYLSLVRRIKAKTVWSNSILRWLWNFLMEIFRSWSCTWKLIMLGAVFIFIHWLAMVFHSSVVIIIALIFEIAAFLYLIREAMSKQQVRAGLKHIAEGEINYQIPLKSQVGDYKEIALMINHIGEGLDAAVEKSMRDERLKTDLITNVSHDIKTPLTSIINYVDLLKRENFADAKIRGYLDILEAKAQRLKVLTEDVVEASKVSSGNINLEFMNVDLVEMLYQANGEFAERFEQKNLQVIMKLPEDPVLVRVDGRQMWRVLENIFNNAAKYTMDGTRIYGDMYLENGDVIFSLKNISANELNISPDELTERFIRGDDSRTTEGSGLGLSIAKSLTELQDGQFKIVIDGDLFKVIIRFPQAADQSSVYK